jgi:hypothetical protein
MSVLNIDNYRQSKGTKGNFSYMFIFMAGDKSRFNDEYVGTYKDHTDLQEQLKDIIAYENIESYTSYHAINHRYTSGPNNNVIVVNTMMSDPQGAGELLSVLRIYTRSEAEKNTLLNYF